MAAGMAADLFRLFSPRRLYPGPREDRWVRRGGGRGFKKSGDSQEAPGGREASEGGPTFLLRALKGEK